MIFAWLIASILSFILYRLGGASHSDFPYLPKWLVKSYTRDMGIPIIMGAFLLYSGCVASLWLLAALILAYGALTTYNKWFQALFGYPTDDVYWPAWTMTGFLYGLSAGPVAYQSGKWIGFSIRVIILTILIPLWSEWQDEVNWEEGGRGLLYTITLPLLLL